jgi:glycine hydroxymethyltransferase
MSLQSKDRKVAEIIRKEEDRQKEQLELIPSENYISAEVREVLSSVFVNKYSEGRPHERYYGGQKYVDQIEDLACERALKMFELSDRDWHVNVQPYSGSPANLAIYLALIEPGDKIMGMKLTEGGHLTHGHSASFSGKLFASVQYAVNPYTGYLDYDEIEDLAKKEKPKIIICGATAYSRIIDFERFAKIAKEVNAYLVADIAHIAGLIVGGVHPSPFPFADVVMTTTHKTLRGPRGAIIICRKSLAEKIDRAVFPGLQGGPHENQIAAMAIAFGEALSAEFKEYAAQVVKNAQKLAQTITENGLPVITGGTDNHLMLVDVIGISLDGKKAESLLESIGIIVNKNTIPGDKLSPKVGSGIRLGSPAITTRGMGEEEMQIIGKIICDVLKNPENSRILTEARSVVQKVTRKYPVPDTD